MLVAGVRQDKARFPETIIIDSDGNSANGALEGVEAIVNCAGRVAGSAVELESANVAHAVQLARQARICGVKRFIQVSSFSVYGMAERIDSDTPLVPINAYGVSKLSAERALLLLSTPDFEVVCVRLPFMFSRRNPALMGDLIKAMSQFPFWPTMSVPVRRSMLTYEYAATLLLLAARYAKQGSISVADPKLFTFEMLVSIMKREGCFAARLIPLPYWITEQIRRFAPSVGRRLFQSSTLSPCHNWAMKYQSSQNIDAEIKAIVEQFVQGPTT